MTEREALKLALSTLDSVRSETFRLLRNGQKLYAENKVWDTVFAIREVLEQPEQEPSELDVWKSRALQAEAVIEKFMAQPEPVIDKSAAVRIATALGWEPKRTWVGLTDEEIEASKPPLSNDAVVWELAVEWAQSQLKEKNT